MVFNKHIAAGTAIVADTTKAVLAWTRMGMTIEVNRCGDAQWTNNSVSVRCEERIAIGVQCPPLSAL